MTHRIHSALRSPLRTTAIMAHAILTEDLGKTYGKTTALRNLNLELSAGQCLALLGPNGAGKSTTLKLLMNLASPTSGHATVLGRDTRALSGIDFQRIGYVSEDQELPLWMTLEEFLGYLAKLHTKWDHEFCDQLLREFDLDPKKRLGQLSRGMRMKAMLISAIAHRPKLLVLDEPFSGLDPLVRQELVQGILGITTESGWSVLLASHDIDEVERLTDSVAVLDGGRLALHEPADALRERFRRIELQLAEGARCEIAPEAFPGWLQIESEGRRVAFVDSRYSEADGRTRSLLADAFGEGAARGAEVRPLCLREIFLILAREFRLSTRDSLSQ